MHPVSVKLDTRPNTDWDSFHTVFRDVIGFPDCYGRNLDTWIDGMTSLDALLGGVCGRAGTRARG